MMSDEQGVLQRLGEELRQEEQKFRAYAAFIESEAAARAEAQAEAQTLDGTTRNLAIKKPIEHTIRVEACELEAMSEPLIVGRCDLAPLDVRIFVG